MDETNNLAKRATTIVAAFSDFYEELDPLQQQQLRAMLYKRWHYRSRRCHQV
jgi:hypothetical protein